jgi:hypothetical protein
MMAKPSTFAGAAVPDPDSRCCVAGCWKAGQRCAIRIGTISHLRIYCRTHLAELERLRRSQGKDWSRTKADAGFDARLFYGGRRGYHAY